MRYHPNRNRNKKQKPKKRKRKKKKQKTKKGKNEITIKKASVYNCPMTGPPLTGTGKEAVQ
jgi:hypothetical protein